MIIDTIHPYHTLISSVINIYCSNFKKIVHIEWMDRYSIAYEV